MSSWSLMVRNRTSSLTFLRQGCGTTICLYSFSSMARGWTPSVVPHAWRKKVSTLSPNPSLIWDSVSRWSIHNMLLEGFHMLSPRKSLPPMKPGKTFTFSVSALYSRNCNFLNCKIFTKNKNRIPKFGIRTTHSPSHRHFRSTGWPAGFYILSFPILLPKSLVILYVGFNSENFRVNTVQKNNKTDER